MEGLKIRFLISNDVVGNVTLSRGQPFSRELRVEPACGVTYIFFLLQGFPHYSFTVINVSKIIFGVNFCPNSIK